MLFVISKQTLFYQHQNKLWLYFMKVISITVSSYYIIKKKKLSIIKDVKEINNVSGESSGGDYQLGGT